MIAIRRTGHHIPDKATPRYQVEIVLRICRRACPSQGPPPAMRTLKETSSNGTTALLPLITINLSLQLLPSSATALINESTAHLPHRTIISYLKSSASASIVSALPFLTDPSLLRCLVGSRSLNKRKLPLLLKKGSTSRFNIYVTSPITWRCITISKLEPNEISYVHLSSTRPICHRPHRSPTHPY